LLFSFFYLLYYILFYKISYVISTSLKVASDHRLISNWDVLFLGGELICPSTYHENCRQELVYLKYSSPAPYLIASRDFIYFGYGGRVSNIIPPPAFFFFFFFGMLNYCCAIAVLFHLDTPAETERNRCTFNHFLWGGIWFEKSEWIFFFHETTTVRAIEARVHKILYLDSPLDHADQIV